MLRHRLLRASGGWLALFAVWLQLALSFGHLDPGQFSGRRDDGAGPGRAAFQLTSDRRSPADPQQQDQGNGADATCAICASMALVGASVLPEPVTLPVPVGWIGTAPIIDASARPVAVRFNLFRTRAPPV
jgi:hypothetical protein